MTLELREEPPEVRQHPDSLARGGRRERDAAYDEVFNIGADRPYSVNELALEIARAFGVAPAIEHLPARNEVLHAFSTHAKVAGVFGTRTPVELRAGIARMAEWARRRGPTPASSFRDIEVRKKLPPSWDVDR